VAEVSPLFEHLENPARLIVMLGVTMGLRIGEMLGLRVEDLDFDTLHVRRSWCRGHAGGTKNGKDREIPDSLPAQEGEWRMKVLIQMWPNVAYRPVGCEPNLLKRLVDLEGFEPSTS